MRTDPQKMDADEAARVRNRAKRATKKVLLPNAGEPLSKQERKAYARGRRARYVTLTAASNRLGYTDPTTNIRAALNAHLAIMDAAQTAAEIPVVVHVRNGKALTPEGQLM